MPRASANPPASTKTLSADHKHLSGLIIALIVLSCVGFLVTYYKIDSDYANQSGDFNHLELRLSDLSVRLNDLKEKVEAMTPVAAPAPSAAMPLNPESSPSGVPYTMPTPGAPGMPNNK